MKATIDYFKRRNTKLTRSFFDFFPCFMLICILPEEPKFLMPARERRNNIPKRIDAFAKPRSLDVTKKKEVIFPLTFEFKIQEKRASLH